MWVDCPGPGIYCLKDETGCEIIGDFANSESSVPRLKSLVNVSTVLPTVMLTDLGWGDAMTRLYVKFCKTIRISIQPSTINGVQPCLKKSLARLLQINFLRRCHVVVLNYIKFNLNWNRLLLNNVLHLWVVLMTRFKCDTHFTDQWTSFSGFFFSGSSISLP